MADRTRAVLHLALGGTIACVATRAGLAPRLRSADLLRRARVPARTRVDGVDLGRRTIVFPRDWVALTRRIAREHDHYDGFVLTLGTDTLAYTAAALDAMLPGLAKPVVLTGAMIPIGEAESDGPSNLEGALRVASTPGLGGVLVVFHGKIMAGASVSKVRTTDADAFESVVEPPLGRVSARAIAWRRAPVAPKTGWLAPRTRLDTRVAVCKLAPHVDAAYVARFAESRGVLVEGYGDGNVPDELVPALSRLAKRRVVVLASQCTFGAVRHAYVGGRALVRAGALSAGPTTKESALVHLMLLLAERRDEAGGGPRPRRR